MNHPGAKFDDYLDSSYPHCMYVNSICVSEIKNILSSMPSKNSCGDDKIPMSILKLSPDNFIILSVMGKMLEINKADNKAGV